jgi:hypothetical protein
VCRVVVDSEGDYADYGISFGLFRDRSLRECAASLPIATGGVLTTAVHRSRQL